MYILSQMFILFNSITVTKENSQIYIKVKNLLKKIYKFNLMILE